MLEEQGQQGQSQGGAHPLQESNNGQSPERLLGSRPGHLATLPVGVTF